MQTNPRLPGHLCPPKTGPETRVDRITISYCMVGSWFAQVVFDWIKAVKKSHWRRGEGRTTPPAAHGEDMLVPFMSCLRCPHHCGTGAIAPPMLQMFTPMSPSAAGPTNNPKPFNFLSNGFGCLCNRTAIRSGISLHRGLRSTMRSRHFNSGGNYVHGVNACCLLYTSPSPRDRTRSRMPSSA